MIASLSGEVTQLSGDSAVVSLGGIGLRVFIAAPLRSRLRIGDRVGLFTHLVVREDALSLYGFETPEELDFFSLLLGVNGVGPRLALSVISVLTPDAIRRAVVSEQSDVFARVPGVGKKTAQKILLHLQGRIRSEGEFGPALSALSDIETEVVAALTSLGYSVVEAQTAIQAIPKDAPETVEDRLRLALQYFSR
jgi:Holliday junction DNA helicase RuvA